MEDIPNISFDLIILVYWYTKTHITTDKTHITTILSVLELFIVFNDRHECVKKSASRTSGSQFFELMAFGSLYDLQICSTCTQVLSLREDFGLVQNSNSINYY